MSLLAAIPLWRARGPRFLMLLVFGWVLVRAVANWPVPAALMIAPAALAPPPPYADAALPRNAVGLGLTPPESRAAASTRRWFAVRPALAAAAAPVEPDAPGFRPASVWSGPDRHGLRFSPLAALLSPSRSTAAPPPAANVENYFPAGTPPPPQTPLWPVSPGHRWSLSAYSHWRAAGDGLAALAANRPATLGGSQSAVRVDYAFDRARRVRAFARVTATPLGGGQADVAIGVAARPFAAVPVDLHIEQRVALTGPARVRTLAYVAGGGSTITRCRKAFAFPLTRRAGLPGHRRSPDLSTPACRCSARCSRGARSA